MGIRDTPFAVLDFETTGLSPRRSEVIEVGAVHVDGCRVGATFGTLCRPGRPIPPSATHVHGITNHDVAECRSFSEHLPELLRFLDSRVIVAHHARFDLSFLHAAVARDGLRSPENRVLCTVRLSRRLFPELAHHDLESLCRHHGIHRTVSHRAPEDARVTAELLDILLERAEEQGWRTVTCSVRWAPREVQGAARSPSACRTRTFAGWTTRSSLATACRWNTCPRRGVHSHRAVVPYVVATDGGGTRLVAYDLNAGTTRTFRLDRVAEIGVAS